MPNPNDYDSNAPSIPEEIREKLFTKPSHALGEPTKALTNALIANGNLRIEIAKLEARLAAAEKVVEAAFRALDARSKQVSALTDIMQEHITPDGNPADAFGLMIYWLDGPEQRDGDGLDTLARRLRAELEGGK